MPLYPLLRRSSSPSATGDDAVAAAFKLFDIDGDGYITQSEMQTYMSSVFKVVYEADPSVQQRVGANASELAAATAAHCFADADKNGDGKLTLEVCWALGCVCLDCVAFFLLQLLSRLVGVLM